MAEATRTIVVNVTPDQFIQVVTDYEKYPEFLPEVKKITIDGRTANSADVTYEIEVIKRIHYTVRIVRDGYNVRWSLVKGDIMRLNNGGWQLRPESADKTHVTYGLEIAFGGFIPVPASITTKLAETSLPGMLEKFKARAETLFPRKS